MTAAQQTAAAGAAAPKPQKMVGEWFWRFLALVMLVTVCWILWIIYQINPQPLITPAGYEAAAKAARVSQDAKGRITPAVAPGAAAPGAGPVAADGAAQGAASAQAEAPKAPAAEPKEPPVNPERLKFSDSIETPIPERGKKK
jgi:hypothetical protein